MTRPHAPTSVPTAPVALPQQTAPVQPVPAQPQHTAPVQPVAQQAAPQQPVTQQQPVTPPPSSEQLPDHLNFTANLDLSGLRDNADREGDQNVGPTK
jgi:cell division transport system ATP-binding protein